MAKNNNLGETPITEKDYSTDQEFEYEKVLYKFFNFLLKCMFYVFDSICFIL